MKLDLDCPARSGHLASGWGSQVPLWILGLSPCLYSELLHSGLISWGLESPAVVVGTILWSFLAPNPKQREKEPLLRERKAPNSSGKKHPCSRAGLKPGPFYKDFKTPATPPATRVQVTVGWYKSAQPCQALAPAPQAGKEVRAGRGEPHRPATSGSPSLCMSG